jgi:hypothetical protein
MRKYRLRPQRQVPEDAEFPGTCKVVVQADTERIQSVFGWLLVELQERSG